MQVVIDVSALLAVLLDEEHRERVVTATVGTTLVAPASLPWELGNAMTASLKRRRFSLARAQAIIGAFDQIPIRLIPVELTEALALADAHRIYAYDAYFLSVCLAVRAPLLTLDRGLRAAAITERITLVEV